MGCKNTLNILFSKLFLNDFRNSTDGHLLRMI